MEISRSRVNQVVDNFDPKIFHQYTLDSIVFTGDKTSIFHGHENQSREKFVFYMTEKINSPLYKFIGEFQSCTKIKVYRTPHLQVIQESFFETSLNDYLNSLPPDRARFDEGKIVDIFRDLFSSLEQLRQKGCLHGNICLNSVVYEKGRWKLNIVAAVLGLYSSNKTFYPFNQKGERTEVYALGVVLFSCLFGFYPFSNKFPDLFRFRNYLDTLNEKSAQDCTKMIVFLKCKLRMSPEAIDILERSLSISRSLTLNEFANHPFFLMSRTDSAMFTDMGSAQQIKILAQLQPKDLSKVLVAIERYKANPTPLRRQNALQSQTHPTIEEVRDHLQRSPFLQYFQKNPNLKVLEPAQYTGAQPGTQVKHQTMLKLKYFNKQVNDLEEEYPCRELIRYLDESRYSNGNDPERQALLMRYGYPYAIALELIKVQSKQQIEVQKKIDTAVELLLAVSNLNYEQARPPIPQLHSLQLINQSFENVKPKYRELIHFLYKHFLELAIYKYNTAKKELLINPSYPESAVLKQEGLNAYRLCWKLLEASLIVRKQGKDLDLGHIETSERKEIQIGLNNLLGKYFPNKIY